MVRRCRIGISSGARSMGHVRLGGHAKVGHVLSPFNGLKGVGFMILLTSKL